MTAAERLAAALNVALAHAKGTVNASWAEREAELDGCQLVLDEWQRRSAALVPGTPEWWAHYGPDNYAGPTVTEEG